MEEIEQRRGVRPLGNHEICSLKSFEWKNIDYVEHLIAEHTLRAR